MRPASREGDDGARAVRPSLPPVLTGGLAMWAVTALLWPRLAGCAASQGLLLAAAGAAAAVAVAAWRLRRGVLGMGALAALCASAALVACGLYAAALAGAMGNGEVLQRWTCVLTEDAKAGEFGWHAAARAMGEDGRSAAVRLNGKEALLRGDTVMVEASLAPPSPSALEYYWNRGLAGSLTARDGCETVRAEGVAALRRRAIDLVEAHGGDTAPLVAALVCGYRAPIEATGAYDQFKDVGLAHLVAVSGAHLSLVTMFVAGGLRLVGLGRRPVAAATALFLAGYVCFAGMPVSALRAAVMAATGLIGLVAVRRQSALAALGLCLLVFVGVDPPCAVSASFALSAGSTLGIVLFAKPLAGAFGPSGTLRRRLLGDPLALTASSALATQPYAAALFSQVPLLSPVANLVSAPLFALACTAGFACVLGAVAVPAAAGPLLGIASLAALPLSGAVSALASFPGTCLPVDADAGQAVAASAAACALLWAWWPRVTFRALTGLAAGASLVVAVALALPARTVDEIVMLDVGQGDAFLVRSQGRAVLVDTGNQDALLREACARQGVRRIDAVAVTHHDDDHCGSLETLGDVAAVGGLLVADDLLRCSCGPCADLRAVAAGEAYPRGMEGLSVGDTVRVGRFTLVATWPDRFSDEGGNGDSLTLLCLWDGDGDGESDWSALLCGDAEASQLSAMAERLPEGGVDVLKVGHHGSAAALDEATVERLAPQVALIGVGASNRYGHPTGAALDLLASAGCEVFRSDVHGDVSVAFSMEKLTVAPQREATAP